MFLFLLRRQEVKTKSDEDTAEFAPSRIVCTQEDLYLENECELPAGTCLS